MPASASPCMTRRRILATVPGPSNNVNNGHPADKFGWAVAAGALFNIPGGHKLGINAQWSEGAAGYGAATGQILVDPTILAPASGSAGPVDGVFTTGGEIELTRVWNVIAFYEHVWNKNWKTSFFGGYVQVEYNTNARNLINAITGWMLRFAELSRRPDDQHGVRLLDGNSCDPDFSFYQVGARTQWNPVSQLDIGLEVMYTKLNTAYRRPGRRGGSASAEPGVRNRRPGRLVGVLPLAAQLLSHDRLIVARPPTPAGNRRGFAVKLETWIETPAPER